jgi:thymidine kinase
LHCVLVDNAEYLTVSQAEDLFYFSKLMDIPVIVYGNRLIDDKTTSLGVCRLMALADDIEKIDMSISSKRATLDFNYGAMNCSKTASLLTKNQSLLDEGYKTCIVKPKLDREELYVSSRIGLKKKADIILDSEDSIYGQGEYLYQDRVNQILVDEAQFLTPRQIDQLRRIVNDYNIPIACYGLKSDFLSDLFPGSQRLLEISDNIYKMNTVCSCGRGADFNVRIDKFGNYVTEGEQVCIDQGDNYDSECALCFMDHVMKIDLKSKIKVRKK